MMLTLVRRSLSDTSRATLGFGSSLCFYAIVIAAFYPAVGHTAAYQKLLNTLPEALKHAFGLADLGTFSGFMGGEFLSLMCPVITAAFAITLGSATVAREVEQGTAELWLSIPLSRATLLLAKVVAMGASVLAVTTATMASIYVTSLILGYGLPPGRTVLVLLELFILASIVGAYSSLFSALSSNRGNAAAMAAGLTVFFYLSFVISGFGGAWNAFRYLTPFTPYNPSGELATGVTDWLGVVALMLSAVAVIIISLTVFRHRDIVT